MAKTLAQGRKPGSGRKPGKGKTLREGRKPGSGRRRRVDEEMVRKLDEETVRKLDAESNSGLVLQKSEAGLVHASISTRDMEAVNALRKLNTSPAQQRQLMTPVPTPTHLQSCVKKANEMGMGDCSQVLIELNKNMNSANQKYVHSTNNSIPIRVEAHSLTGISNVPIIAKPQSSVVVDQSGYSEHTKRGHGHNSTLGSANRSIRGAGPTEKVLISI